MTNEELKRALAIVAAQNAKALARPKRDRWDKFTTFAPLISGVLITGFGVFLTTSLQNAQKETEKREKVYQQKLARTEMLAKFLPFLAGKDEEASMAIVAIASLGDPDLMQLLAKMNPSDGIKAGLALVAASGPTDQARDAASTTLNVVETVDRARTVTPSTPLAARALEIALGELNGGVKEDPPGSNRGPRIDEYHRALGLKPGLPWSGIFVSWCYLKAGVPGSAPPFVPSGQFSVLVQNLEKAGRWKARETGYAPKAGDLAIYQRPDSPRASHGGVVVSADEKGIFAIEGNVGPAGSKEAIYVAGKTRPYDGVKGYGDMSGE